MTKTSQRTKQLPAMKEAEFADRYPTAAATYYKHLSIAKKLSVRRLVGTPESIAHCSFKDSDTLVSSFIYAKTPQGVHYWYNRQTLYAELEEARKHAQNTEAKM